MTTPALILDGLQFGESPRWHDGRLWVCDWATEQLLTVGADGTTTVVAQVPSFPFSIDWHPDGRLLVTNARAATLDVIGPDGGLTVIADLATVSDRPPGNEIVVHPAGHVFVNGGGFDLMRGEPYAPGMIAHVDLATGSVTQVAGDLAFPNGMAITPDGGTLICAESYAHQLTAFTIAADGSLHDRRVWAHVAESAPDGICLDAAGAAWFADVPNRHCVRVAPGGEVLDVVAVDRGCFACMLGGPDGVTLFIVARRWEGVGGLAGGSGSGQVLSITAPHPHAGRP